MSNKSSKRTVDFVPVSEEDFDAAMKQILDAPPKLKSENRQPTKEELNRRFRMVRRKQDVIQIFRKELEDIVGRASAELKAEIEVVRTEIQTVRTELAKQHTRFPVR